MLLTSSVSHNCPINGDGDRISQTYNNVTTTYMLDVAAGLTNVLAETTGSARTTYTYGYGIASQKHGSGSPEYFMCDGLGSVRQVAY
jgi:hypothetical protein